MRNDGSAFGAAMEMNSKMESVGEDLTKSMFELAKEITGKPIDTHTEAEKNFIKAIALFSIMGLISSRSEGTIKDFKV